jgi:hypothetical protein
LSKHKVSKIFSNYPLFVEKKGVKNVVIVLNV